jgi:hypothetical protein
MSLSRKSVSLEDVFALTYGMEHVPKSLDHSSLDPHV